MDRSHVLHGLLILSGITAGATFAVAAAVRQLFRRGKKITDLQDPTSMTSRR